MLIWSLYLGKTRKWPLLHCWLFLLLFPHWDLGLMKPVWLTLMEVSVGSAAAPMYAMLVLKASTAPQPALVP